MFSEKIKALDALKMRVAELEREIAAELNEELARLPAQFGFHDTASFIDALREAAGDRNGGHRASTGRPKTRKRVKITDRIRSRVRQLAENGETGAAIAKRVGISLPSVQNIKKALGLVKSSARRD